MIFIFEGLTGHTEVVRVVFSPGDVSLEELLKRFWESHDPTQGTVVHSHAHIRTHTHIQKKPSKSGPQISAVPRGTWCIRAEG